MFSSEWLFDPTPYLPASKPWKPRPHTLEKIKSYFAGYGASGRAIYPKRETVAAKIGIGVRTLARYLRHLAEVGFLETVCRKAYTAIRKLLGFESTGPSAGPSIKVTSQGTEKPTTTEVLNTPVASMGGNCGDLFEPQRNEPTEPPPHSTPVEQTQLATRTGVPVGFPEGVRQMIGICIASGKGLSKPDMNATSAAWFAKNCEGFSQAVVDAYFNACRSASAPRYVPAPAPWLLMEGWTRCEVPRKLPATSKLELQVRGALDIIRRRVGR